MTSELAIDPETGLADVEIPGEYVELCRNWYAGQSCMLYAVGSTGGLTLGSQRPYDSYEGRSLTDQEWHVSLWNGLSADIGPALRSAEKMGHEDLDALTEFATFIEDTLDALRALYGLEDSEVV